MDDYQIDMSDKALLKQAAKEVREWVDGGCSSWGVPSDKIMRLVEAAEKQAR